MECGTLGRIKPFEYSDLTYRTVSIRAIKLSGNL